MANRWTDLGGTGTSAIGNPVFTSPIVGVKTGYILTQPFMQLLSAFTELNLNTAHPTYTDYLLVEESPREDLGGGLVKWNRIFAKVPAQHVEMETIPYNFIGLAGTTGIPDFPSDVPDAKTGRYRFVWTVPVKVQHDYFLLDGSTYTSPQQLAYLNFIEETRYYRGSDPAWLTDWLVNSPPWTQATTPTLTSYNAMVAADAASATSFSLVAQSSVFNRWRGNIFQRQTRYIKAL